MDEIPKRTLIYIQIYFTFYPHFNIIYFVKVALNCLIYIGNLLLVGSWKKPIISKK